MLLLLGMCLPAPARAAQGLHPVEIGLDMSQTPVPGGSVTVTATGVAIEAVRDAALEWRLDGVQAATM